MWVCVDFFFDVVLPSTSMSAAAESGEGECVDLCCIFVLTPAALKEGECVGLCGFVYYIYISPIPLTDKALSLLTSA